MKHQPLNKCLSWNPIFGQLFIMALLFSACDAVPKKSFDQTQQPSEEKNQANVPLIWKKYLGEIDNSDITKLFDYSYAGHL